MNSFPSIWNSSSSSGGGGGISGSGSAGQVSFFSGASAIAGSSNLFWDNTNNFLGLLTNVPTHTLTLGSTSTGQVFYNTADQTTNFERVRGLWSGNVFSFQFESGGTGTVRSLRFVSGNSRIFTINPTLTTGTGCFDFTPTTTGTPGSVLSVNGAVNATSGIQSIVQIVPTVTQTGSAAFKAIYASPFLSSTGSGGTLLVDIGTNSAATNGGTHTSLFTVDSSGNGSFGGVLTHISLNTSIQLKARNSFTTSGTGVVLGSSTYSPSSGQNIAVSVTPTYAQTGTASATDFLINRTQTSVGSGAQNLIEAQVGGATRFGVSTLGRMSVGASVPSSTMVFIICNAATDRGIISRGAASQTAELFQAQDSASAELFSIRSDGRFKIITANTATTVGATGAASALPALPLGYIQAYVNGAQVKIPYYNN